MEGDEIRSLREELGVSQQELARRLQVAHSTVNRWENGLSSPSGEVLARLQRLRRFKEFMTEGRMVGLGDLLGSAPPVDEGNGLPPWHPDADRVEAGHLSLITSPPRCGKTLTALRWAWKTLRKHGVPVYYVSTHWTPLQTLRHLEKGLDKGETLDSKAPFFIFQHDGKDVTGLLEELSRRIKETGTVMVVFDWLQNLDYKGERFLRLEDMERQILRDLKTWATQQKAFTLVIASQRGIDQCSVSTFPHFFELADSITIGVLENLKKRRVVYAFQDLHKGGQQVFEYDLPPGREMSEGTEAPTPEPTVPGGPRKGLRGMLRDG